MKEKDIKYILDKACFGQPYVVISQELREKGQDDEFVFVRIFCASHVQSVSTLKGVAQIAGVNLAEGFIDLALSDVKIG